MIQPSGLAKRAEDAVARLEALALRQEAAVKAMERLVQRGYSRPFLDWIMDEPEPGRMLGDK